MSEKKGFGSTVLGWFVVREGGEAAPPQNESTDDLIAKYAQEEPPPPPPEVKLSGELPRATGGKIDFPQVYRAAGITDEEQDRIDKALNLLGTLPLETPREVKKQIVEASLKAFGYPVDKIIETGAQEIQALEMYIQHGQRELSTLSADSKKRIDELNAEIALIRKAAEDKGAEQAALTNACNDAKLKVQQVLEFFGQEAVAKVVKESPKLHEPK